MTIKVPVTEISMGVVEGDAIVGVHTEFVRGRISLPQAKKMFPDHVVVGAERHFKSYDVDDDALAQFLSEHTTQVAE